MLGPGLLHSARAEPPRHSRWWATPLQAQLQEGRGQSSAAACGVQGKGAAGARAGRQKRARKGRCCVERGRAALLGPRPAPARSSLSYLPALAARDWSFPGQKAREGRAVGESSAALAPRGRPLGLVPRLGWPLPTLLLGLTSPQEVLGLGTQLASTARSCGLKPGPGLSEQPRATAPWQSPALQPWTQEPPVPSEPCRHALLLQRGCARRAMPCVPALRTGRASLLSGACASGTHFLLPQHRAAHRDRGREGWAPAPGPFYSWGLLCWPHSSWTPPHQAALCGCPCACC